MYQLDMRIWNQIAPLCKNPLWAHRMRQDLDGMHAEMDHLRAKLQEMGVTDSAVRLAYMELGPLYQEHEAVAKFLGLHPGLRDAVPVLETPKEACHMAIKEWALNSTQIKELWSLLTRTPAV